MPWLPATETGWKYEASLAVSARIGLPDRVASFGGGLRYAKCEPSASPVAAAQSPPPGPLKLRDFVVSRSGDVAVAAFFHDRDTVYYGQTLHQTYRSMETWLHQGSAWKMVSSQGRAVQSDPPAIEPASDQLSDYIG